MGTELLNEANYSTVGFEMIQLEMFSRRCPQAMPDLLATAFCNSQLHGRSNDDYLYSRITEHWLCYLAANELRHCTVNPRLP